jgi:transposase
LPRSLTLSATHDQDRTTTTPTTLYLAFELGGNCGGLAFATAPAQPPRRVTIPAPSLDALQVEITHAKRRFHRLDDAPGCSCDEAGRAGFWRHRWLTT